MLFPTSAARVAWRKRTSKRQAQAKLAGAWHVCVAQILVRLAEARIVDLRHEAAKVLVIEQVEHLAHELEPDGTRHPDLLLNAEIDFVQRVPRSAFRGATSPLPITSGPSQRSRMASGMATGAPMFKRLVPGLP
jgi:hypothetical protein